MARKTVLGASLLTISIILVAGSLTNNIAIVRDGGVAANSDHPNASLDVGFDGTKYSSQASPRTTHEILSGKKEVTRQSILDEGTSTLNIDIPSGWNAIDLSTKVYQLYENRSFTRNPDFSTGYTQVGRSYPNYWTNWSLIPSALRAEWNNGTTAQNVSIIIMDNQNLNTPNAAGWTQIVYVNGTNLDKAKLAFKIKKSPNSIGIGNDGKTDAIVYINKVLVYNKTYSSLSSTSYVQEIVDVKSAISSLTGNVNVTLSIGFSGTVKLLFGGNGHIYYDDVYLYINSTRFPQAVNLTLNGAPVVGQQYGTGTASLHGALTTPFLFASNTTGRVKFICNSTINVRRIGQSDATNFTVTQGLPVNQNVTKLSFFNSSCYIFGSTNYTRDIINVSIPYDWTYSGLIFPNGTLVSWLRTGLVQKYPNGSYSWIIMVNASGIRSYRPNPYTVIATSPNYLGAVSTFRSSAGNWVAGDFFTNGSRIKINATVQGDGRSKGSAHVLFYNATTNAVWRDMSLYPVTAGSDGNISFNFKWSDNTGGSGANISRSDLTTLVVWNNGSEVGVKWVPISFDLTPPQPSVSGPTSGQVVRGVVPLTMSCVDVHFKTVTLFINGTAVINSSTPPSGTKIYPWDTTTKSDGPWELRVRGWDQVDHVNETRLIVYVDNTPPSLQASLPAAGTYVRGGVPLAISWRDSHPKNVTLFINGSLLLSLPGNLSTYNWNTELLGDGVVNLAVIAWDLAGNFKETTSQVIVDNTPPVLGMSLTTKPQQVSGNSYVAGDFTLNISCVDPNFRNVALLIDGMARGNWTYNNPSYRWNTTVYSEGVHTLAVRCWDLAGNENQTTFFAVHVDNTPPTVPGLLYPNDGETVNGTTPKLVWGDASDGAGSGVDHYFLELDTSPYFNSSNHRVLNRIESASFTIPASQPLSSGTWYWRICAVDRVGNVGQYSTTRSFQVSLPGLPVALLVGVGAVVPALAILSSVVFLRRRKRAEAETFNRKSLVAAYVFSEDGRCMFNYEFKEVKIEPQLLSGFLTAISNMMKEVIGGSGRALRTIERPDAKILLEFGDTVTGALVAKKSSGEYRRRLKAFLSRFEHDFADKISGWDGIDVFGDASEIVEEVFPSKVKVATYPTIVGIEDLVDKKIGSVAISVAGKTGSGKSTFCLWHAASLLKRGRPVIIVDGSMPLKDVRKELRTSGVDVGKLEEEGLLILYDAHSEISGIESKEKYKLGSPGELNTINLSLSRNLSKLKNATVFFDSLTAMIEYSDLELAVDFIRTIKVKLQQGEHTAFFIIDSNAHDTSALNYISHVMDGEIETTARRTKKGETERLVSFKRLNGFQIKTGYHQIQ